MKTVAIIQARLGSSRLPGKVLLGLSGKPVLQWVVDAALDVRGVDLVVVATSDAAQDDQVAQWCKDNDVECYRGSEADVLQRYIGCINKYNADIVMRLTADCPLLDPNICSEVLLLRELENADYASNCDPASWPDGLDCEVVTADALKQAACDSVNTTDREHVTAYIQNNRAQFKVASLVCSIPKLHEERWTLDTEDDLLFLREITARLNSDKTSSFIDVMHLLKRYPELRDLNASSIRNEGYAQALLDQASFIEHKSYLKSSQYKKQASKTIPLAAQTFSKSYQQFPKQEGPLFITHGDGCRVWDVDGNEYIDLISALLPVVLGYRDPDVDYAIRSQLNNGIVYSASSFLETQLAEKLVELIPSAEMVRFGKNGTDVTSAAIRLARAFTNRERVMVGGYHGWQDWYIGSTTRNLGVPVCVRELTHTIPFNDLGVVDKLLHQYPGEFAACILEPMNVERPHDGYFDELKDLLHKHGALLIFDEIITGFRFSLGGAQEYFGACPDLSVFGKAMANGMPMSAVVGRKDIMKKMDDIFFSGTFGGETLSIAASLAVIHKMENQPVIQTLWSSGKYLCDEINRIFKEKNLSHLFTFVGADPWKIMVVNDADNAGANAIKEMLLHKLLQKGVLTLGSHNVSYAHSERDLQQIVQTYEDVLTTVKYELDKGDIGERLGFHGIDSVFKVRN